MPFDPEDPDANKNRDIAKALVAKYDKASQEIDPADFKAKKNIKGKPIETQTFENWVDNTINPKESMPDMQDDRAQVAQDMWNDSKDLQAQFKTWQEYMDSEDFEEYVSHIMSKYDWEPAESTTFEAGTTFEDIKPYVSMYKGDDGKTVHDVLDKDENSVYKTDNAKDAMNYLSKNFSKLRGDTPKVSDFVKKESIKESKTKIVAAIKAKADENAQNIAGVEAELERIAQLANYQN
jgi:hypothetical protein